MGPTKHDTRHLDRASGRWQALRRAAGVVALGALMLAAGCGDDDSSSGAASSDGSDGELTSLKFGVIANSAGEWPTYILKDRQFDRKHGLDVELVTTGGAPASVQQAISGDLPVAEVTIDGTITARSNGAALKLIGGSQLYYRAAVVAKPDIKTLEDLRGKKISVVAKQNPTYFLLADQLEQHGIPPSDWNAIAAPVPAAARYAGLKSGALDAAVVTSPTDFQAERDGFNLLLDLGEAYPDYGFSAIAANDQTIASQRPLLTKFMTAYADAINWLLDPANEEVAKDILQKHTKATDEDTEATYALLITEKSGFARDGVIPERYIAGVQEQLSASGVIEQEQPASEYVDNLADTKGGS